MGWCHELDDTRGEHEGFLVALEEWDWVRKSDELTVYERRGGGGLFREVYYPDQPAGELIRWVQVGCDCGWRSPRMLAPQGTRWMPHIVLIPEQEEAFEERCRALWDEHVRHQYR